jgi:ABC-type thiamin/hydroxymethylpyrimidine transport system permease subunit
MRKSDKDYLKVKLIIWASMIAIFCGWVYLVWLR